MKAIDDALRAIILLDDIDKMEAFARRLPGFNPKTDSGFCVLSMLIGRNSHPFFFDYFMRRYARHYSAEDFYSESSAYAPNACAYLLETGQFDKALCVRSLFPECFWDEPGPDGQALTHYFAKSCFSRSGRAHARESENLLYAEICASSAARRDPGFFLAAFGADNDELLANMAFDGALGADQIADLAIARPFSEFCARYFERSCKLKKHRTSGFEILLDLFCSCAERSPGPEFAANAERCLSALRRAELPDCASRLEKACIADSAAQGMRPKTAASL